jgi:hypothetical protein
MLKTAAESYTRRMFSEFETEFKDQFLLTGQLLQTEGSVLTYMVTHMQETNDVPPVLTDCSTSTISGKISFRVPRVVKGLKNKRSVLSLEKRKGKKKKSGNSKGIDPTNCSNFLNM